MNLKKRALPVLLAVSYGLVATVWSLLHDHHTRPGACCSGACGPCGLPAESHDHDAPHLSGASHTGTQPLDSLATDDSGCAACRFLDNGPVLPGQVDGQVSTAVGRELVLPGPAASSDLTLPPCQSRSPPQVP